MTSRGAEPEQVKLWNGPGGDAWVELQQLLDGLFAPLEELLAEAVAGRAPCRVLDVGCGTGTTTLAAARRLRQGGSCTGIDISQPMLEHARARAERAGLAATFVLADAQTHPFEPAVLDLFISRFGAMFFADPVAAFANLRRAAAPGAELRLVAWRDPAENPFMTAAERAAAPFVDLPPRQPGAPGQFSFADPDRVRSILTEAGWTAARLDPLDTPLTMPETDLLSYLTRLGPVGRALPDLDAATRAAVLDALRPAFDPFVAAGQVRFTAACWLVSARA